MVYSRILDIANCVVVDPSHPGHHHLEPGKILEILPSELSNVDSQLVVIISDGVFRVEFKYEAFLARSYPIRANRLHIGGKKLTFKDTSIFIGFKVLLEDLSSITESSID